VKISTISPSPLAKGVSVTSTKSGCLIFPVFRRTGKGVFGSFDNSGVFGGDKLCGETETIPADGNIGESVESAWNGSESRGIADGVEGGISSLSCRDTELILRKLLMITKSHRVGGIGEPFCHSAILHFTVNIITGSFRIGVGKRAPCLRPRRSRGYQTMRAGQQGRPTFPTIEWRHRPIHGGGHMRSGLRIDRDWIMYKNDARLVLSRYVVKCCDILMWITCSSWRSSDGRGVRGWQNSSVQVSRFSTPLAHDTKPRQTILFFLSQLDPWSPLFIVHLAPDSSDDPRDILVIAVYRREH
jgi:hypothetical protein